MADVVRYVNPASSGGDGTTNATSGGTAAFASMNAALTSAATNKLTTDRWLVYCEGTTADTVALTLNGAFNTTAANPIVFLAVSGNRHEGTWNASRFRQAIATGSYRQGLINCTAAAIAPHLVFRGIQFSQEGDRSNEVNIVGYATAGTWGAGSVLFEECLFRWTGTQTPPSSGGPAIFYFSATAGAVRVRFQNCIGYDGSRVFFNDTYDGTNAVDFEIDNCTFYGMNPGGAAAYVIDVVGNEGAGSSLVVRNTFVHVTQGGAINNAGPLTRTYTTCKKSDALNTVTGWTNSTSPSFVNAAGRDFHLQSGDTALKDAGTDLSGTFTIDVDGATRADTWDIGADEITAAVVLVAPCTLRRAG